MHDEHCRSTRHLLGGKKSSADALLDGRKWLHKERIQTLGSLYLQLQKEIATIPNPLSAAKTMCCNRIFIFAEMELQLCHSLPCSLAKSPESLCGPWGVKRMKHPHFCNVIFLFPQEPKAKLEEFLSSFWSKKQK